MGAAIVFVVMAVLGAVGLATGHDRTGLTALVIGGIGVIGFIAALARRTQHSGGAPAHNPHETTSIETRGPGQEQ